MRQGTPWDRRVEEFKRHRSQDESYRRIVPTNPAGTPQSGKIIVSPGEFNAYASISLRSDNQTIDFTGSIVNCYVNDACIMVGDRANSINNYDITLINPRGRPMVASGIKPFIEAVASREIVEEDKFRDGLGKVIDGTVQCLNASTWSKGKPAQP
jgi:hypothetical protein